MLIAGDVDQVVNAVNPVEKLLGGGLGGIEVLGASSKTLRIDALSVKQKSSSVEVTLGLADASSAKDGLEGGLKLQAIRRKSESHLLGGGGSEEEQDRMQESNLRSRLR